MRVDKRWFWRKPCGVSPEKRRRPVTWPDRTSGDTALTFAAYFACRIGHFRFHPQTEIVRIALRHLDLDLESGQIDDGEERCILRNRGALARRRACR